MYNDRTILAVIPARGGSRGVPRKNIAPLGGKPLLVHTLEQLRAVPEIDRAVVSTDDAEIADVATAHGDEVVTRPAEFATAESRTEEALLHAMDHLEHDEGVHYDYVCVLEPTSPFRRAETISKCIATLLDSDADSLMTVVETRANIGRMEEGVFKPLNPGAPRRRQDREPYFIESSTVYLCRADYLRAHGTLVSDNWLAVQVSEREALDINEPIDLLIAQSIAKSEG